MRHLFIFHELTLFRVLEIQYARKSNGETLLSENLEMQINVLMRYFRSRLNQLTRSFNVDPEIYPLMALVVGSTIYAGCYYTKKFLCNLDDSRPFSDPFEDQKRLSERK